MEEEKFKSIPGYEGLYEVSNKGNVKSLKSRHNKEIILKKSCDKGGYEIITLCKDKIHKTKTIHRLVAESFLGSNQLDVNHKDGNKKNNNINNLEYITKSANSKHAIENKLFIPNFEKIAILKRKKVIMICPLTNQIINKFNSAHEAAKITGYNRGNISTACRENKIFYNKIWKYEHSIG